MSRGDMGGIARAAAEQEDEEARAATWECDCGWRSPDDGSDNVWASFQHAQATGHTVRGSASAAVLAAMDDYEKAQEPRP